MTALLFHHHRHLLLLLLLLTLEPLVSEALREKPATPLTEPCCSNLSPRITTAIALVFLASITTILWYIGICRRRNVSTDAASADGSAKQGLEKSMIDSFGIMLYSEVKELKLRNGPLDCAICLCEFEEADSLRLLPVCSHAFHPCCIDTWLFSHTTCPVCRASLIDGQLTMDVTGHVEENRPGTSGGEMGRNEWTEEERERFTLRLPETLRLEMMGRRLERSETMGPPATGAWKGRTTEGFIFLAGRKEWAVKSDRYVDVLVGRAWLSSPEYGGSAVALDGSPVVEAMEGGGNRC